MSGIDACRNGECSVQGGIWLVLIGAGVYHILIFVLEKDNSTILDLFSGVIVLVIGIFFVYESNCGCETADSYAGSFYFGWTASG